jgi:hypothetical protein
LLAIGFAVAHRLRRNGAMAERAFARDELLGCRNIRRQHEANNRRGAHATH